MTSMLKKLLSASALVSVACTVIADSVVTQFNIRPQSFNTARKVSGEVPGSALTFLPDQDNYNGYFGLTLAYNRSFRPGSIAHSLFGDTFSTPATTTNNGCNECDECIIQVQGSDVVERNPHAWLADYFYLPSDYNGTLEVKPTISNIVLDFNWYMGLDEWVPGLYFRIYAPFVHSKWNLNLKEGTPVNVGSTVEAGKFTPVALSSANLLASPLAYFAGNAPTSPYVQDNTNDVANANRFTTVRNGLCFGKMIGESCGVANVTDDCNSCDNDQHSSRTRNAFGEIRAELGWNFWQCEDWHLGLGIEAAAPTTGKRPNGHYLFDAMVGNGGHWELGGLLTAHYVWWRSECEDKHFGMYLDANITHLFKANQTRVFDLKGKPLSRYMLAAQHTSPATNNLAGSPATGIGNLTNAQYQFTGVFTPVANLTAQEVKVSVGVQADVAAWFNYSCGGFSWDLGYNYFGRSCEKITCGNCPPALTANTWTLKGDANVYGYQPNSDEPTGPFNAQPLSVSESAATIHTGTNLVAAVTANPTTGSLATVVNNVGVDAAQFAVGQIGGQGPAALTALPAAIGATNNVQTKLSIQPTFLAQSDIDYEGSETKLSSNKVFTHFNYKWDRECWEPYIGVGGEAEFGQSKGKNCDTNCETTTNNCNTSCDSCRNIAISQWGVWFKTGIAYN